MIHPKYYRLVGPEWCREIVKKYEIECIDFILKHLSIEYVVYFQKMTYEGYCRLGGTLRRPVDFERCQRDVEEGRPKW